MKDATPPTPWGTWPRIVAVIIGTAALYWARPWIQPFFLTLYRNPFIIQSAIIGAAVTAGLYYVGRQDIAISTGGVVTAAFFFAASFLNVPYQGVAMADDVMAAANTTDTLPGVSVEHPRILPRSVASQYAQNSLQEPRHRLAPGDIAIGPNGTPQWSYALRPDGGLNRYIVKQKGAAFVNMSTSDADIEYDDQRMEIGVGTQITDNIKWVLRKNEYFVNYQDPYVFESSDNLRIATPYIDYEYRFRFPILYTVPVWDGVALTDADGTTSYIEANEVSNHPELSRQRSYPFELARAYVAATAYRRGIINKWFFHEDEPEVAPVPGLGNDQPFMVLTEDNPELFIATEPYGDASGLFEIWTVDAVTGDYERYSLDRGEGLIGADKAVNFVRQANSRVSWASRGDNSGFTPIEPLPVIVDDTLHWQIRVVPVDSAGVAFTAFVNAESSTVYTAQDDQDIRRFLRGDERNESQESDPDPEDMVTVSIIDEGEVVTETTVSSSNYSINVES